jgi:hypothetical protein
VGAVGGVAPALDASTHSLSQGLNVQACQSSMAAVTACLWLGHCVEGTCLLLSVTCKRSQLQVVYKKGLGREG